MSGFITAAGENYLLDLVTASGNTLPSYFIALMKEAPPSRHISGNELDEPRSVDYGRAPYINVSGRWTERISAVSNTENIIFPVCTTEWGVLRHWAICSSDIGGDVLWAGSFTLPITVGVADQVILQPGTVSLKTTGQQTHVVL